MTGGPSSSEDANAAAVLRDISDTALWVAIDRARETERRHPLFRDPYARRLAGERGQRIARAALRASVLADSDPDGGVR